MTAITNNSDNPIIIFGSSRSNGNTYKAIKVIRKKFTSGLINLAHFNLGDFDYKYQNKNDDFLKIIDQALEYKTIILATPIYWYTMCSLMKRFVDRLSDLLDIYKNRGRSLRNKNLAVITSYSIYPEGKDGFEQIFINIAKYLGMNYIGCYFHYSGENSEILAANNELSKLFINRLLNINSFT